MQHPQHNNYTKISPFSSTFIETRLIMLIRFFPTLHCDKTARPARSRLDSTRQPLIFFVVARTRSHLSLFFLFRCGGVRIHIEKKKITRVKVPNPNLVDDYNPLLSRSQKLKCLATDFSLKQTELQKFFLNLSIYINQSNGKKK